MCLPLCGLWFAVGVSHSYPHSYPQPPPPTPIRFCEVCLCVFVCVCMNERLDVYDFVHPLCMHVRMDVC